ncbi:hypothetical protein D3C80_1593270 [compost metagenome]
MNQANAVWRVELEVILDEFGHPGAGRIDQGTGPDRLLAAVSVFQQYIPYAIDTLCADTTRTGTDVCPVLTGGHGVEYHQAGVVHGAIGVFETAGNHRFERVARTETQAA